MLPSSGSLAELRQSRRRFSDGVPVDAACTAGREARGGCGRIIQGPVLRWGSSGHVYHRQVPHKDRFLIDLSGPGLEGSVWLPNCLKFGSLPRAEPKHSV